MSALRSLLALPFLLAASLGSLAGQLPPPPTPAAFSPVPAFDPSPAQLPRIGQQIVASKPFSVLGPRGCLLGEQNGSFEAWVFPWKIFSGMTITAHVDNYAVPIVVNDHAAQIDVEPHETTITYSHANFTVRQIMFAPKDGPADVGALVFFEVEAVRPLTLTFSFTPVMQRMWPAESPDAPSPEWVANAANSGFYILHLSEPSHAAGLAMPGATSGILAPYQERAHTYPLQFVLHVDPKTDSHKVFPLLMTMATTEEASRKEQIARSLSTLNTEAATLFNSNRRYYETLLNTHTQLDTPDKKLDDAFSWAIAAIDQLKVKTTPGLREEALTAGFVASGDAARPGFGWYFGRDALWSLYAVDSYGDYVTLKQELEFLLARQSPEGKIIHEWAQTASLVDWAATPYIYASSDATTLLPMVMSDYLRISGDQAYIAAHWGELLKAWQFELAHTSPDGFYNNGEGSGWVESWIPTMPHQEIYLAALDQQASTAFARLARATGHAELAQQADARAAALAGKLEQEYSNAADQFYSFSHNDDGTTDRTATIFPAVAWWDGTLALAQPEPMLRRWASDEFSTDWGTRLLSDRTSFYDPISYHQGTVWPLFTGWVSVAEYRAGHPLSGYAHLRQNMDLTWAQDPGSTTELLSGQFYQVLGRSTAHQLWSSAMVISPILRGLFGLEWDAPAHTLTVSPHLPADWNEATIRRLPFGTGTVDLAFHREGATLVVSATGTEGLHLASTVAGAKAEGSSLRIPLPAVEVAYAPDLPPFGAETQGMKVLSEQEDAHSLTLELSAPAGSRQLLPVRANAPHLRLTAEGGTLETHEAGPTLTVLFPAGSAPASPALHAYVTHTVTLRW